jgi:hypothetical protein
MTHPAVIAYRAPKYLPSAAGLALFVEQSRGIMATAQARAEVRDTLRALLSLRC